MRKNYRKNFEELKKYIRANNEKMKLDFELFASKIAFHNIDLLIQGLDEKSSKDILLFNLKKYNDFKVQIRDFAKNK